MPSAAKAMNHAATAAIPRRRWRLPALAIAVGIACLAAFYMWPLGLRGTRGFEEYKLPHRTDIPVVIAVGTNPTVVWFTLESSDALGVLRDGQFAFVRKDSESIEPLGLAVDEKGAAWFTEAHKQRISRVTVDGAVTSFGLTTRVARLGRLSIGPEDTVWFAESSLASVTQLKDGRFTRHSVGVPTPGNPTDPVPFGVAVASDGTVWATLQNVDALLRIAPSGDTATIDVPIRQSGLGDIAVGNDGVVWFLAAGANKIARFTDGRFEAFTVPTPNAGLTALAVAPDGAAWFTELRGHRIGRVHRGEVTEFVLPRANARPFGIAVDAANNVWYTDLGGWVGKLEADRARVR